MRKQKFLYVVCVAGTLNDSLGIKSMYGMCSRMSSFCSRESESSLWWEKNLTVDDTLSKGPCGRTADVRSMSICSLDGNVSTVVLLVFSRPLLSWCLFNLPHAASTCVGLMSLDASSIKGKSSFTSFDCRGRRTSTICHAWRLSSSS